MSNDILFRGGRSNSDNKGSNLCGVSYRKSMRKDAMNDN